ncbi:hypothetical protein NQL31_006300 [Lotmaria passim]
MLTPSLNESVFETAGSASQSPPPSAFTERDSPEPNYRPSNRQQQHHHRFQQLRTRMQMLHPHMYPHVHTHDDTPIFPASLPASQSSSQRSHDAQQNVEENVMPPQQRHHQQQPQIPMQLPLQMPMQMVLPYTHPSMYPPGYPPPQLTAYPPGAQPVPSNTQSSDIQSAHLPQLPQMPVLVPMQMMYPPMYAQMPPPGYTPPPLAAPLDSQPGSQRNDQPPPDGTQRAQLQQMQMQVQMQMMYPHMYPPMYVPGYSSPPGLQPHSQRTERPPQQDDTQSAALRQRQRSEEEPSAPSLPMYAPWHAAPQQQLLPPSAILTSDALTPGAFLTPASVMPAQPTTAMGYVPGIPSINLGLQVAMASPKKILIYYVLLFFFLLATGLITLGIFFTPVSSNSLLFTRPTSDIMEGDAYAAAIGGATGQLISNYARYAPCTVLKQYGCEVFKRPTVSYWLSNVTNGMREPFPALFALSNVSDAVITSCAPFSYVVREKPSLQLRLLSPRRSFQNTTEENQRGTARIVPGNAVESSSMASPVAYPYLGQPTANSIHVEARYPKADTYVQLPGTSPRYATHEASLKLRTAFVIPERRSVDTFATHGEIPILINKTGLRVDLYSSHPNGMQATFFATCNSDQEINEMLKITAVQKADLAAVIPVGNTAFFVNVTPDRLLTASPNAITSHTFDPDYTTCAQLYVDCNLPSHYILFAATNQLRRCGGGPVTLDSSYSDSLDPVVYICSTAPREGGVDPNKNGDLFFIARGAFLMGLSLYATSVRFPNYEVAMSFGIEESATLFIVSEVLVILAIVLTIVAANLIPVQRFKLRQLRAALEVDASVAMEILYRAQGAFTTGAQPAALPSAPAGDAAATAASEGSTTPPHPSMYVASPFYRPVPGLDIMQLGGALMVVGPQTQPSPYGQGHYLPRAGSDDDASEDGAAVRAEREASAVPTQPLHVPREDAASHAQASRTASLSGSVKGDDDTAFAVADGVVSPTEVALSPASPASPAAAVAVAPHAVAAPRRHGHDDEDDAQELRSLHSAASAPPSEQAGRDEDGVARMLHSTARPHAAPATTPLEEPQRGRTNAALLSGDVAAGADGSHGAAPPNTDWMFTQTRHLVSPDVLEESTLSSPRSQPVRSRLQRLRDRLLQRRSTFGASASIRANFPRSDTDDTDDDGDGAASRDYAEPEGSPGERTIQLFVARARNSYRRMRHRQIRTVSCLVLYVGIVNIISTVFIIVTMAFQFSGSFVDFEGKLQYRDGDSFQSSRTLQAGHIAQFALALATSIMTVVLAFAIGKQRIW